MGERRTAAVTIAAKWSKLGPVLPIRGMMRRWTAPIAMAVLAGVLVLDRPAAGAPGDIATMSISAPRGMSAVLSSAALTTAAANGASATLIHQGSLDLVAHWRFGHLVWSTAPGWIVPLSTQVIDPGPARPLLVDAAAEALGRGEAVLGTTSASVRSAVVGDVIEVVGWNGQRHPILVGAIVGDAEVFGAELLIGPGIATAVGLVRPDRVLIWNFDDPVAVERALVAALPTSVPWKLRRSWDPANPDAILSQARLKAALGEFAIRRGRTTVSADPAWVRSNIVRERLPLIGTFSCHKVVMDGLRGALTEVEAAGLGGLIDVRDSRRYGGCYGVRELRTYTGSSGRNLSRHSWGGAIDLNPSTNGFGRTPTMDPRVVDIFRRHGFAWGGSFTIPDGMHFEWVGLPDTASEQSPVTVPEVSPTTTTTVP